MARPLGILDGDEPNLLWFTFTDERARSTYLDWDDIADEQVANLHELRRGDTDADAFAARLSQAAGAEFTDRWERRPLGGKRTGVRGCHIVGVLRLAFETLELPDPDYQRLVVYLPAAAAATAAGLDRLTGRQPGALRSVSAG